MPSKSAKQHRLMAMVANDPKAAKRLGIPQSVGRDYVEADKGRKFGSGGSMKESKAMMRKEVSFMKKKGAPKSMIKHEMSEMADKAGRALKKRSADTMGRAMVKKMAGGGMSYSGGGSASSRADGIAMKGKTKGKMVRMNMGGKC
jgi:hypothetical protein